MKSPLAIALPALLSLATATSAGDKVRSASGIEFASDGFRAVTYSMW